MKRSKAQFLADGVLVVDKPAGPSSHDVVARLRGRFKPAKLGHAGTLDPFATGVLVLAFNRLTRVSELLGGGEKLYRARLKLGAGTDTDDREGQVVREAPVPALDPEVVRAALTGMTGPQMQAPPAYSAVKHQGKPLYAYARQGVAVEKAARPIVIHRLDLVELAGDELVFDTLCSRGTYVRTLGRELAESLGTVGHLTELRRLLSAPFSADEGVGLEEARGWEPEELAARMLPPGQALARCGLPALPVDQDTARDIRQGLILDPARLDPEGEAALADGQAFQVVAPEDDLVAVMRWRTVEGRQGYENIRVFTEPANEAAGASASVSA